MTNFLYRFRNRLIAFFFDLCMIFFSWLGAYWVIYNLETIPSEVLRYVSLTLVPVIFLQSWICWFLGLYRGVWRFASIPDLIRIIKAVLIGTFIIIGFVTIFHYQLYIPRVVPILYGLFLILSLSGARAVFRWLKDYRHFFHNSKRILIVGAGHAGESLIRDLLRHTHHLYQPIAMVDDNPIKIGREIHGVRVVGKCDRIPEVINQFDIDLILIAIPSASSAQMRRVVSLCEQTKLPCRTLPGINDLATGRVDITLLRNVSLEDLLGRDQVQLDWQAIGKDLQKKIILVSGGGGSIGSELCRQIAPLQPKELIIIDNSEYNLYSIDMELRKNFPKLRLQTCLLSITDEAGINHLFSKYRPDMVFHAAAYKHVPLLETQIRVAIQNNIIGTYVMAKAAVENDVKKFILISTDKAVNPANLMGATKRAAEMVCQNLYSETKTKFITVRFGNVLDSAGSVVPLFRKQIQQGGPLTVTHPDITRYFMSIPEASQLIVQAAILGKGEEIFVLDMGEPIKIRYLAEQMIKFSGKKIGHDIDIVFTGLRPGEKLYEELFYSTEILQATSHHKIMQAHAQKIDKILFADLIHQCEKAYCQHNENLMLELLLKMVPEYVDNAQAAKANLQLVGS